MNRLGLLALLLAGCVAPAQVGTASQAIVGGTNDTGDPAVVLVIAQQTGSQSASLCTGEIVSPHVVMTAAHCVSPQTLGSGTFTFQIFTGDDINNTAQQTASHFVAVKETHYDQQFDANNLTGGHDVGVVITKTAMTPSALPMNTAPMSQADVGTTMRIVGYGISSGTDTTGTTAGVKRQTNVNVNQVSASFIDIGNSQHETCEGDSGGPAFMTVGGSEVIAGITSFGQQGCVNGGEDTRVDVYGAPFVQQYINMFDNGMTANPPDMAQPPGNPDMASSGGPNGGPAPGTVGASCTNNTQCQSNLCAKDGDTGYCTTGCDPSKMNQCPSGLTCGQIDTGYYCIKSSGGGCDFAGGGVPGGMLVLVLLGVVAFASRRRWA